LFSRFAIFSVYSFKPFYFFFARLFLKQNKIYQTNCTHIVIVYVTTNLLKTLSCNLKKVYLINLSNELFYVFVSFHCYTFVG